MVESRSRRTASANHTRGTAVMAPAAARSSEMRQPPPKAPVPAAAPMPR
jgi:hypothetical protein